MSFPKQFSVEVSAISLNGQRMFKAIVCKGSIKASACSPVMRQAILKAIDYFETKFTIQLQEGLVVK